MVKRKYYVAIGFTLILISTLKMQLVQANIDPHVLNGRTAFFSVTNEVQWEISVGGIDYDSGHSLIQTTDNGFLLAGETKSWTAGGQDFWLVKTNAEGVVLWNMSYGGPANDEGLSVIQTTDGGYAFVGYCFSYGAGNRDFWLVKTDVNGTKEWSQTYGGTDSDISYALIQTEDGGYAMAGRTDSFGAGSRDFWLVKTDENGTEEWNQTYGGTEEQIAYDLIQTADGGYALAGMNGSTTEINDKDFWLIKTDVNGTEEWNSIYGTPYYEVCYSFIQTIDGGFALIGETRATAAGDRDYWIVKADVNGTEEWNKTYGGTANEVPYSLVQTIDEGYALLGSTTSFGVGETDSWLIKIDSNGLVQWNQTYGGADNDQAESLVQCTDGGYALGGYTDTNSVGNRDFWLVKTFAYEGKSTATTITSEESDSSTSSTTSTSVPFRAFESLMVLFLMITVIKMGKRKTT